MKKLMYISIIAVVAGLGCKKGFLSELQNNPNSPTTSAATVQLVLPGTITSLVGILNGVGSGNYQFQAAWEGYWNYSGGYSFNQTVQEYIMTNTTPQIWDGYYGVLTNLNVIKQQANASASLSNYGDIASILGAICYKGLVDAYNDVPYSEALKGSGNFYPKYDKGSDIYDSIVANLDAAMADITANMSNASVVTPGNDDAMFGGDMSMWVKFANTVKLKCLVQQSAVSAKQAYLTSEAGKTNSYGYLDEDALVNPNSGYNTTQPSPMYANFGVSASGGLNGTYNYIRAGGFALDFYKNNSDPRLGYFYSVKGTQPTDDNYYAQSSDVNDYYGDYLGIQVTQPTKGSGIGPGLIKNKTGNQAAVMMLAAESYFVQAEAAVRGYLPGGSGAAHTAYNNGIVASMEYLGIPNAAAAAATYEAQATTYIAWPTATADQIHTIIYQKWAALNGISCQEGWNDWRRTGYPNVPGTKSPTATQKQMPYRYYYPVEEPNDNADAWQAAGGDKVNPYTDKIFWMP
ncbi:MAG TPA: SusD/RagB family nutrient-binding outer membrane lipoprotein [Chitinophagaceae bacterium]|nr:SusD/RagB family nutrient-binding outer membrane lipoprotein [Chitinophagaceae bacterium]